MSAITPFLLSVTFTGKGACRVPTSNHWTRRPRLSTCLHAALSFPLSFVCFGLRLFYVGGGVRFPSFWRRGDPPCLALVEAPLGGVHEVLALLSSRGLIGVVHSLPYQLGRLGVVTPCRGGCCIAGSVLGHCPGQPLAAAPHCWARVV